MSHVAKVECLVRDLDALEQATKKFNATLVRGKRTFNMWGSPKACIHAITVDGAGPRAYEVGLTQVNAADPNTFEFACDFYDGSLARTFGANLVNLRNEYHAQVAENMAGADRWRVTREETPTGVRLYLQQ